jgi:hypothetical protein
MHSPPRSALVPVVSQSKLGLSVLRRRLSAAALSCATYCAAHAAAAAEGKVDVEVLHHKLGARLVILLNLKVWPD